MVRKYKRETKVDRAQLRLHTKNYIDLGEHETNTIATYVPLHNGLESLTQKHKIPSIGSLGEIRSKDVIMQEIKEYTKQVKKESNQEGLEVTKNNIIHYAIGPSKVHMKLS